MRFLIKALMASSALLSAQATSGRVPGMAPWKHYIPDESHFKPQTQTQIFDLVCTDNIFIQNQSESFVPLTFSNGSCHDPSSPNEGLSSLIHIRTVPATYTDGRSTPIEGLPNSRAVSNVAMRQPAGLPLNMKDATRLMIFFGQFVDHDFALVLEQLEVEIEEDEGGITDFPAVGTELIHIETPEDDENTRFLAAGEVEFARSVFCIDENFQRQFVSVLTPYLDLSQVYADTPNATARLRAFTGGRMAIDTQLAPIGEFMPRNALGIFQCGDVRCEENTHLFAWHTLWLRNHNFWAERYADERGLTPAQRATPFFDEVIFNHARVRNIIEYQVCFWNQYIEYLLGRRTFIELTGLYEFDESLNPVTTLEFTTAVFRYGHSGVSNNIQFFDEDFNQVANTLALADAFFNAERNWRPGNRDYVGNLLLGQSTIAHDVLDSRVQSGIRDNLFRDMFPPGFDLTTRNLERARDHGIGFLNDYRIESGLVPYRCPRNDQRQCFRDLTGETVIADGLFELYQDFAFCELWVCGMAETNGIGFEDSLMGETFTILFAEQFNRIRNSDRLWYENPDIILNFTTQSPNAADIIAPVPFPVLISNIVSRNTNIDASPDGNVFMVRPVWLSYTDDTSFQVEWFISPNIGEITPVNNYLVEITPGDVAVRVRPTELYYVFPDSTPGTTYTVTVSVVSGRQTTLIGETTFRSGLRTSTASSQIGSRSTRVSSTNGLSAGAVAGIAIGAGVVAVGAVAAFFLARKRSQPEFNNETFL